MNTITGHVPPPTSTSSGPSAGEKVKIPTVGPKLLDPNVEWIIAGIGIDIARGEGNFFGDRFEATHFRDFTRELAQRIYRTLHAGMTGEMDDDPSTFLERDLALEGRIAQSCAEHSRADWLPLVQEMPEKAGVITIIEGVRVFVPATSVIERTPTAIRARIKTTSTRLSVGFTHYTSRAGGGNSHFLFRLYRHAGHPTEAVDAWERLTGWLEQHHVPARAKITSRGTDYPRNDAIVVYLPAESWHHVRSLRDLLASASPMAVTSPLTRRLGQGIGGAWEPADPATGGHRMSYGEHRSRVIASTVVRCALSRMPVERQLRNAFLAANVDPSHIYQNLDSPPLESWL